MKRSKIYWPLLMAWLALLLLFSGGCSKTSLSEAEQNAVLAKKMFDAFNRHAWDSMAGYYADDAMYLDPSFGKEYVQKTRKQTAEKYREMASVFPDIRDEIVDLYASGDRVTIEFVSTGTAGDTLTFKLPVVTVLTFAEGLIVRDATYYDLENP